MAHQQLRGTIVAVGAGTVERRPVWLRYLAGHVDATLEEHVARALVAVARCECEGRLLALVILHIQQFALLLTRTLEQQVRNVAVAILRGVGEDAALTPALVEHFGTVIDEVDGHSLEACLRRLQQGSAALRVLCIWISLRLEQLEHDLALLAIFRALADIAYPPPRRQWRDGHMQSRALALAGSGVDVGVGLEQRRHLGGLGLRRRVPNREHQRGDHVALPNVIVLPATLRGSIEEGVLELLPGLIGIPEVLLGRVEVLLHELESVRMPAARRDVEHVLPLQVANLVELGRGEFFQQQPNHLKVALAQPRLISDPNERGARLPVGRVHIRLRL
mmetsp:Transcript_26348/g.66891  ORF Transcript_26348/g.66891 Transcript_26348/m.66891 type:complete len:334 (+) Transcript_26348:297-1298(+)